MDGEDRIRERLSKLSDGELKASWVTSRQNVIHTRNSMDPSRMADPSKAPPRVSQGSAAAAEDSYYAHQKELRARGINPAEVRDPK